MRFRRGGWMTRSSCAGLILLGSLSLSGCRSAIQSCTGAFIARGSTAADLSAVPDRQPPASPTAAAGTHDTGRPNDTTGGSAPDAPAQSAQSAQPAAAADGTQVSAQTVSQQRFRIPSELPGADAAPLQLPPFDPTQTVEDRRSLAATLFPQVTPAEDTELTAVEPRLTLASLQQMAVENSPVIRQAAADVEQARGKAVQAGLYPNPTLGYQGDTIGTARTAGYNGVFFSQEFITADKLSLAQNAALFQMRAAEAELRKARIRLASSVRRGYFRVLVAQEQLRFNRALAELSEEVYQAQIDLVTGGEAAPYEPLQLRVFAVQSRNNVIQSQNTLNAEWRQLAAALGLPQLTRHPVAGSIETALPAVDYERASGLLLQRHSDLAAAQARIASASCNLRLQQVTPIPNVSLYAAFQHDDTTPLSDFSTNVQLSVPVPIFDRNQGNISSAHAQLIRANQDFTDTQNTLLSSLADLHARQASSRTIAASYRSDLLPDQVRVYRGVYERFRVDGEAIDFSQLVVAQQTLGQVVTGYLTALSEQWNSTVDLAELLQIDDLMTMDGLVVTAAPQPDTDVPAAPVEN